MPGPDIDVQRPRQTELHSVPRIMPRDHLASPRPAHLLDYVKVVYRRRWIVIVFLTIGAVLGVIEATNNTREYEGKVQFLIESNEPQVTNFKGIGQGTISGLSEEMFYQTQVRVLKSRTLARRTLDSLNLWHHPDFGGGGASGGGSTWSFSPTKAFGAGVSAVKGFFSRPDAPTGDPRGEAAETRQQSRAIDIFLSQLDVTLPRNSRILTIAFRASEPKLAADVANAVSRGYIELNLESRLNQAKDASDFLGEQLASQRKQVETNEQALQRYREQNDAVSLDERQNIVVQKLADLNSAVTKAKTLRIEKEALYNQLKQISDNKDAIDTFPAILADGYIQQLKADVASLQRQQAQLAERYGERHPDLIKAANAVQAAELRLRTEINKVVQSVRNDYLSAHAQETSLAQALEAQKSEAQQLNRKAIEYGVLQRDAAMNRQLFDSLLQRSKETGIAGELKTSSARVVDPAEVPRSAMPRNRIRDFLFGALGGLLIGLGLAFFFDYLDNRIKTPDEIRAHLGLPFLGLLPMVVPNGKTPSAGLLLKNGMAAPLAEALRTLRTNVLFSSADEGMRSLLVTSTQPGEGKTMVSCNLALALAQAGHRVLLIDADLRQPKVHKTLEIRQGPGLSNLIVGAVKFADATVKGPVEGLWVLTAGNVPPNPAELLGSRRFREFIGKLHAHFSWVVIDSPPVLAVTDAVIVSHSVSDVLLVVGSEMTARNSAQQALSQLENAQARMIGAVLNRVELQRHPYYYESYSRAEYSRYYTAV